MIKHEDIVAAIEKLGLSGKKIAVHSSFKSFDGELDSPNVLIEALMNVCATIMMPAFTWESNTAPPLGDRPENNGCDYKFYDNWNKPLKPFIIENAGIEKSMGIIAKKFLLYDGVFRSDHSWHSWATWGEGAKELVDNHPWETSNLPLERLSESGGHLLLIGVDLRSCTALHISEERAGRKPFVRWMVDRNENVRRVAASGCAKGFNALFPYCADLFKEIEVGHSTFMTAPLRELIAKCADVIRSKPDLTICSPECVRCRNVRKQANISNKF